MDEKEEESLFNDQEKPALGLRLRKTPSFLNFIQTELSQTWNNANNPPPPPLKFEENSSSPDFMSQPMSEKLKASNFPATILRIGFFERVSRHESDLVAKLYYAKRKLVWEFLEGPLKKKIEIQWSDIGAMRAVIEDGQPGVWEIELNQPPLFFHEINPQPRKHTLWQPVGDFTNGQASRMRRHFVKFPRGVLDRHYEKLLQCDPRLRMLSLKPFPAENPNMFFQPSTYEVSELCLDFQRHAAAPNALILRPPNPYLTFPSHMIAQTPHNNNNNWLLQTTMLPAPNNLVHILGGENNNEAQSSLSVLPTTLGYPTHMDNQSVLCKYVESHLLADHESQVPAYNNDQMTTMVGSLGDKRFDHPNVEGMSLYGSNLQNEQAMGSHHNVGQGCLDVGGTTTTLYHGSPWVPSQFTNGDHSHSPCSTSNSTSSPPGCYPNQDFRHDTQDWA